MLVLNLPFKALMFLTLMRPSLVLFLVLWLKLVKDFLKVRSEERFSRNAETYLVCRLLLEKKNQRRRQVEPQPYLDVVHARALFFSDYIVVRSRFDVVIAPH